MNIYDYFVAQLKLPPDDTSLRDLPVDSPCGHDCKVVIDKAVEFLAVCDPHDTIRDLTAQAASEAVGIYWRG